MGCVKLQPGRRDCKRRRFTSPTLCLLDLGLPDMDGLQVLQRLREWSDVPVLVLSVRDQEPVKVAALEAGADDYVTKPFGTAELLARLKAIQRRRPAQDEPEITVGRLRIDLLHHTAHLNDEVLKLTPTEFALLKLLARNVGKIVIQKQILREVWPGTAADAGLALRVHVNHLRTKLGGALVIKNEPGIGYRLEAAS